MKTKKLSAAACDALAHAGVSMTAGEGAFVKLSGALDRKVYVEVNKALENYGGKWNRRSGGHVFPERDATELKDALNEVAKTGEFVDKKQTLGFFETPDEIADLLVKLADVQPGMSVLEPSAGCGRIVHAIQRLRPTARIWAVEIDAENVKAIRHALQFPLNVFTYPYDFLKLRTLSGAEHGFDRIVMNPPFAKHADIEHVRHACDFLAPGGRLVSVMSNHVTFAEDAPCCAFRKFVSEFQVRGLRAPGCRLSIDPESLAEFIQLPTKTFAASGTNVNTVMIVLEKPK